MSDEVKNVVYLQCGRDVSERIIEALKNRRLFGSFIPTPAELCLRDGAYDSIDIQKAMELKYGYIDWKSFNLANWGTKWDVSECSYEECGNGLKISFSTANTPPFIFYRELSKHVGNLSAYYFCEDAEFAGKVENGEMTGYEFIGLSYKNIKEIVPIGILKEFDIINCLKASR